MRTGPDGLVRIAVPARLVDGDLFRDTSARASVGDQPVTQSIDVAPNGSGWLHGTGGDYRYAACA